ncbi:TetR/AcrR family transcriptional regulator [Antrihabitans sp. YC2-6]|uniref:TetR/AcrR family transcriptional regulator n=1 Tax=Antrihabitans sp. YC2-6 TaxID=2799498 RepID=UPI0018F7736E|nr:TetR/AcrR family transcriptional regulator [Antrihabitans sp. YC2-6]MBJ8344271.1 TetR/AcrR family transcriptional regulator [Antrihabitans sp. YC2-6]
MAGKEGGESRLERRKMRTRAALIAAAQRFIAAGKLNVPVLEITQAADVGMGSFYNHFESKDQLFEAAVDEALDAHGVLLDALAEHFADPAEMFAQSFRLTGRFHRRQPDLSRVLLNSGPALITAERGLAPRALRDIEAGIAAGRFTVADPQLALVIAGGAAMGLGQLLQDQPERDDAEAADQVTEDLLRMFGIPAAEAKAICSLPLPNFDTLVPSGTAA